MSAQSLRLIEKCGELSKKMSTIEISLEVENSSKLGLWSVPTEEHHSFVYKKSHTNYGH